jgi:integrase
MNKPNLRRSFKRRQNLSNDQLLRLFSIADADPKLLDLGDIVRIIATTGIRVAELKNLRWACVDFPNNRLIVNDSKGWRKRCIPIGAKTREILHARHDRGPVSDFVLGERREALIRRVSLQLRVAGVQSGLGPLSFHIVRHSFFTLLVSFDVSMSTLMSIGGWKPFSSLKTHSRPSDAAVQAEYERVVRGFARLPQI